MGLSKEVIKREIVGAIAAIKAHEEGLLVNKLVLEKFEEELKKFPEEKNQKRKNPIVD